MKSLILFLVFLTAANFSFAAGIDDYKGANPSEKLTRLVSTTMFICKMKGSTILINDSLDEPTKYSELRSSITDYKAEFTSSYKVVKLSLENNKDALSALNDYAALVLASYDDLNIRTGESNKNYSYRLADLERTINTKASFLMLQL